MAGNIFVDPDFSIVVCFSLIFFSWHVDEPEPSSTGLLPLPTSWLWDVWDSSHRVGFPTTQGLESPRDWLYF